MTADELKEARKELQCTAKELATALGLPQAEVMAWEKGDLFPTKQFVDKIEKEEQGEEADGDEDHGAQDLGVHQPAKRPHDAASAMGLRTRRRKLHWLWRTASAVSAARNTPPCRTSRKPGKGKRPLAIQLCPRLIRL